MAEETKTSAAAAPASKSQKPAENAAEQTTESNDAGFKFVSERENFNEMSGADHARFVLGTITSLPMFALKSVANAFKNQFTK